MMDNNAQELVLWCTVHDESAQLSPFKVTISAGADVTDLKKAIQGETKPELDQFAAHTLVLWKVRSSRPVLRLSLTIDRQLNKLVGLKPRKTLAARIGDDISPIALELEPSDKIGEIFPEQPPEDNLHIIVEKPAIGKPFSPISPGAFTQCYSSLHNHLSSSCFGHHFTLYPAF